MNLRVLFATDHVHFPQGGGGGERNTHELCLALRDRGVIPGVMSSLHADGSWLSWSNRFRRSLVPGHQFPCDHRYGYSCFRGWSHHGADEVVHRFGPQVVVLQSTHPAPLLQAFTPHRLPIVIYVHEVEELDPLCALAGLGIPFLANSTFTARRLLERCSISARVVLPLVDRRHYATRTRPERVLFVNTVPRKGLEIAFAVAEARPDIPFDFVSSWILKPEQVNELRRRARAIGNITLHEATRDMRRLYRRTRVLLAPSQWEETWGRVATEAHMNGIPVIASDRGGLPQAVGPGGLLVPADAPPAEWVAALSRLWDDADAYRHCSAAAQAYSCREEIQPETIVDRLLANLNHLVAANGAGCAGRSLQPAG